MDNLNMTSSNIWQQNASDDTEDNTNAHNENLRASVTLKIRRLYTSKQWHQDAVKTLRQDQ